MRKTTIFLVFIVLAMFLSGCNGSDNDELLAELERLQEENEILKQDAPIATDPEPEPKPTTKQETEPTPESEPEPTSETKPVLEPEPIITTTEPTVVTTPPTPVTTVPPTINYQSLIRIKKVDVAQINSVGGVDMSIYWGNLSPKTIKYITFTVEPYNAVGDVVACEITRRTRANLKLTGPINTFSFADRKTEVFYYNFSDSYTYWTPHINPDVIGGDFDGTLIDNLFITDNEFYYYSGLNARVDLNSEQINSIMTGAFWDAVWYNATVKTINLIGVEIEYMDGSKVSIPQTNIKDILY